jgi:hypothetical protein
MKYTFLHTTFTDTFLPFFKYITRRCGLVVHLIQLYAVPDILVILHITHIVYESFMIYGIILRFK